MKNFKFSILKYVVFSCIFFFSCKSEKPLSDEETEISIDSISNNPNQIDFSFLKQDLNAYVLPWSYLINVKFEDQYNEKMGMEVSLPIFNDTLKYLDGKNVIIEGFYIPVDETGNDKIVILSAYPFAQCFFCGKAGVESIIDVLAPQKLPNMKVDSKIKFKGKLKLNRDNFDYLIYVLEEAEYIPT